MVECIVIENEVPGAIGGAVADEDLGPHRRTKEVVSSVPFFVGLAVLKEARVELAVTTSLIIESTAKRLGATAPEFCIQDGTLRQIQRATM